MLLIPAAVLSQDLSKPLAALSLPSECSQVVCVISPDWPTTSGTLRTFDRDGSSWKPTGFECPVMLGRSGLGWGMGIISFNGHPGPLKIEGDGRAPAGVFDLPLAFGRVRPEGVLFPFRATGDRDYWVDDVTSSDYNTWQRIADGANDPKLHWKSVERMVTKGPFYDLGIVVGHNTQQTVKWRGSAIFLHLWEEGKLEPTAGCTSMSKPSMIRLMTWLDANKRPLLVQLPAVELR